MSAKELPMPGQVLHNVESFGSYDAEGRDRYVTTNLDEAHVTTSMVAGSEMHRVVLDIDMAAVLLESSTPGHHHLYIDHSMTWEDYERLLEVMADVGLLEVGYVGASKARKHTAVRLPWIRKEQQAVSVMGGAS
jgi:hypothetical protein